MMETSKYFKAVPVFLPCSSPARHSNQENLFASPQKDRFGHTANPYSHHYFPTKRTPNPDVKIRELRSNNPFQRALPGEKILMSQSESMYGEETPKFQPTRSLADFDNPFSRKHLVASKEETPTEYLKYMDFEKSQEMFPVANLKNTDFEDETRNQELSLIRMMQKQSSLGSKVVIQRTAVFDPSNQSVHSEVDYEELEREINLNSQTFKLVGLKRAGKL